MEEETRIPLVEISSTSTGEGEDKEVSVKQETEKVTSNENEKIPQNVPVPAKATTNWEVNNKGPTRTLERKRFPTETYEIDIISKVGEEEKE